MQKEKFAKPFTRKQSVYVNVLTQLIHSGQDIANAIIGAKQAAAELNKL